jgi:Ca2+/Na+ antiporter
MKMKNIILILIALLFLPLVSGQGSNQDFNAIMYSGGTEICSCTQLQDSIVLTNNEFYPLAFTLKTDSNFYTLSEEFIILEPFESFEIYGYFNPICTFSGKSSIKIEIESNNGNKRIINKDISVLKCNNNLFSFNSNNAFVNDPCLETRYDLRLINSGNYPEVYDFSVEGLSNEEVQFSMNSIFLQPDEEAEIFAYVALSCDKYGEFKGNFVSKAQTSEIVSKLPFLLNIERNYNFSLSLGFYDLDATIYYKDNLNYTFCADLQYEIPVKIQNDVIISNAYDVNVDGNFITTKANRIGVQGYDYFIFNLTAKPKKNDIGNTIIPLEIVSQRGSLATKANLNIDVIDCFSFDISVDYEPIACCGENIYQAKLTNLADIDNYIELESNANLSYSKFLIEKNHSVVFDVKSNLICDAENNFYINASNLLENKIINIPFNVVSNQACQEIIVHEKTRQREIIFYNGKTISLFFQNKGISYSDYLIILKSPEWITINETNFSLNPGEIKNMDLFAYPNDDVEPGIYNVEIVHISSNGFRHSSLIDIDLRHKTIKDSIYVFVIYNKGITILFLLILLVILLLLLFYFKNRSKKPKTVEKVSKKEIKKEIKKEVKKESKKIEKIEKKSKKKKSFLWRWILLFLLLLIVFIILFIQFKPFENIIKYNETESNETESNETLFNATIDNQTLVIEPVVEEKNESFIIIEEVDEPKPEEEMYAYIVKNDLLNSFLYHYWYENEVYIINLDDNFYDPDGEPLVYASSFPDNIEVIIDGSIAYLTPKENWKGVEKIYFRATDTGGDFIISPEITLIVREKSEESKYGFNIFNNLSLYTRLYIAYVFLGIVLLVITLIALRKKK